MTREEIMKMDGQAICAELYQMGVLHMSDPDMLTTTVCDIHTVSHKWNLPACAFAVRDYVVNNNGYRDFMEAVFEVNQCPYYKEQPLDWLRAAAIVIAEQSTMLDRS